MPRFSLEEKFRVKLIEKAAEIEGGEAWLGRRLGYSINFGYRVRQLKRGEVSLDVVQLRVLSKITGISMDEIMKYAKLGGIRH